MPRLPATLSEAIVTGLLRQQMGYDGVVFSDDLAMRAISDHYRVEEATALAIRAGVDVLLFCHEIDKAVVAFEFLCDEADRDAAVRARIEESYERVTELKRRYLTSFTGVAENEIAARLEELNHRRVAQCLRMIVISRQLEPAEHIAGSQVTNVSIAVEERTRWMMVRFAYAGMTERNKFTGSL